MKKKIKIFIFCLLILLFSLFTEQVVIKWRNKQTLGKINWYTSDKIFDLVTGNGKVISFNQPSGGIYLLPLNYKEKQIDIGITVRDPLNNSEKNITVLKNIPELTNLKFTKNRVAGSKIWFTSFHQANDCQQNSCKYHLYEFDVDNETVNLKKDFIFFSGQTIISVSPLVHDPKNNIVWIAVEYKDEKYMASNLKTGKTEQITAFLTDFVKYDANTNDDGFPIRIGRKLDNYGVGSGWSLYGIGTPGKLKIADVDKNGDLYIIATCEYYTGYTNRCDEFSESSGNAIYRISSGKVSGRPEFEKVPLFLYSFSLDHQVEITIDPDKQVMYLAIRTWGQSTESQFFAYEIDRQRTFQVGVQPTQYKDDIRGFAFAQGKLLIGTFNGLGVYDPKNDGWKMITTSNGLKDNNVELIDTTNDNGICIRHENNGTSCLFKTLPI